jgi:hypothetical protein
MSQKRLVIFAEGEGDAVALPILLSRLFTDQFQDHWHEWVFIDSNVLRIGGLDSFGSKTAEKFSRFVQVAQTKSRFGGVLIVLDADSERSACLRDDLNLVTNYLKAAGAGVQFPAAVVLIEKEYESLFLASYQSLEGRLEDLELPEQIESVRGCKEWLNRHLKNGYAPIPYQAELTRQLSIDLLKAANHRSFRRLQHALEELYLAMQDNRNLLSPELPT